MPSANFISWNINRANSDAAPQLIKFMSDASPWDIIMIQESLNWATDLDAGMSHRIISSCTDFPAALIIHSRHVLSIRWYTRFRFGCACVIGPDDNLWFIASLYLPCSNHGLDLFEEALSAMSDTVASVPRYLTPKHTVIGCDANTELVHIPYLAEHVGHICTGTRATDRTLAFALHLPAWGLKATNTFPSAAAFPCAESPEGWTHHHYFHH